ncbi:EF-hand [Terfezia boudieri ATCC MYA-4762]|uniref:Calmodulin n=1 Tax=Terfezia boudieri ATCC MYA-4762 TaxID=1051890 RepID=A0A3N4LZZ2_9PEZI|nr:EF-hand [Terfezia boudieri ATCC MYA-4762]
MPPRREGTKSTSTTRKTSKLAKELKLTAEEEDEIREAFDMFVDKDGPPGEIQTTDVRKAMLALGFEASRVEMAEIIDTLDPENEGIVMWDSFIRLCALKMKYRDEQAELERAYRLFTNNTDGPITIFDLKRIARELKENVTDEQLTDMLMEASGGMTVNLNEFEGVMKRAGAL